MFVNPIILAGNPFFEAFSQSDTLGKLIFISLYGLSIVSWVVIIHKLWITHQAKKSAQRFYEAFQLQKNNPLNLECDHLSKKGINPFVDIYKVLKKQALDVMAKNRHFQKNGPNAPATLSLSDIDYLASHMATQVAGQIKNLDKNLYILSTTIALAPFLGLLGTVWGILTSFSEMLGQNHDMVIGGLSMALATTVLGLIDAIPALIGYNYLKNSIRDFSTDMEGFSNDILANVELQYRRVDG